MIELAIVIYILIVASFLFYVIFLYIRGLPKKPMEFKPIPNRIKFDIPVARYSGKTSESLKAVNTNPIDKGMIIAIRPYYKDNSFKGYFLSLEKDSHRLPINVMWINA